MSALIHSKLNKPQLPSHLIHRSPLISAFGGSQLILVTAQAGAGKSTLVSQWLDETRIPHIWYSLDSWDNSLNAFLTYLAFGLRNIDAAISNQMVQLLNAQQTIEENQLIRAIMTLLRTLGQPYVLVLDDYHTVQAAPVRSFVKALIKQLPNDMKLVVISREKIQLPVAKLKSEGKVTELQMKDLKLNYDEAVKLVDMQLERTLAPQALHMIYNRTEGWLAGLHLLLYTLKQSSDMTPFLEGITEKQQFVMDYLMEEVLENQSDDMRDFLLKTALLNDFTPQLCDAALDLPLDTASRIIEHLEASNTFLVKLDEGGSWYRYHHLFRDLLLHHSNALDEAKRAAVYLHAGDWYSEKGYTLEAMDYYLKGNCYEPAAKLIELNWGPMDMSLRSSTWLEYAMRLPETVIGRSPILTVGIAWSFLDKGDVQNATPWFERAERLYEQWKQWDGSDNTYIVHDRVEIENFPGTMERARAYIAALRGDYEALMGHIENLRTLADQHQYNKQWIIDTFVSTMHWGMGELDLAIASMVTVKDGKQWTLNPVIRNTLSWIVAELLIQKGDLTAAEIMLEAAMEEVMTTGTVPILMGTYTLYLAMIESIRGEFSKAHEWLEKSQHYGHRFEFMDWRSKYALVKARLLINEGAFDAAKEALLAGKGDVFPNPIPEQLTLPLMTWWLRLAREGSLTKRDQLIKQYVQSNALVLTEGSSLPMYADEMKWKLLMRYASPSSYGGWLRPLSAALIKRATEQKRWLHVIEWSLLSIRFAESAEQRDALLLKAQQLAELEQIRLPFMEYHTQETHEALTAREREILGLIEKGYSNQQIADHLFISLSTVKSYNNDLFSKLGVKNRTQAVAKAKLW